MRPSLRVIALVALALCGARAFVPIGGGGNTHVTITGNAVMKKIYEVCEAVAESEGRRFKPTGSSAEELLRACLGTAIGEVSGAKFHEALNQIYTYNGLVDRDLMTSNAHHMNNEAFAEGKLLIRDGVAAVKVNIRSNNLQAARESLGRVLHTLQDFYSHSNWVELGYRITYANLIRPDLAIDNVAEVSTPTCSDCADGTCANPVLPEILKEKKLTSGYMGLFSSDKPKGKCSHGGNADLSSGQDPRGGISKDERRPHNADLHDIAVNLATEATLELLEDIRGATSNNDYLRMMGIARSAVLSFVIDTTGSMSDDIAEAKRVAFDIIDRRKGTLDEPSEYILVQFNDPSFGPLIRTTNPDVMKLEISKLGATGGGDEPEMCLSGLQLALTGASASSNIFVFTDASPKDMHLRSTILALMRSTNSEVFFFLTVKSRAARSLHTRAKFDLYYDLALASGGLAIEVSKANLPSATDIILDTSTSALVTILQRARNSGLVETFTFLIDESLTNVTAYFTGSNLKFTLRSPSGKSQPHSVSDGPLATIHTVGNLQRVQFKSPIETGTWSINMESTDSYTIKVTGQSPITFIYDFVEVFGGPHPGFAAIDGRPQTGSPAKLLLTLTGQKGGAALKLQEVSLVEVSQAVTWPGTIEGIGDGKFLVTVSDVSAGELVVMIKGEDVATASQFQRQSTTQMSLSKVTVKSVVDSTMLPGKDFDVSFTVNTTGAESVFTISARNDRDIVMIFNDRLTVTGGIGEGKVTLKPPADMASGTDVTLTILAEAGDGESNYAVLRLSALAAVTDFTPPKCTIMSVSKICPSDCTLSDWDLSVNITDGDGSGIRDISVQKGSGDFSHTTVDEGGIPVVVGFYNSSCCTRDLILSAVDKEGNVGRCVYTMERNVTDFTPPKCTIVKESEICPSDCTLSNWDLSVKITDGDGSGIEDVSVQKGSGDFSQITVDEGGIPVVMGFYNSSCCRRELNLTLVDKEGNVGECVYTMKKNGGVFLTPSLLLWLCLLVSAQSVLRGVVSF
ncbi:von Willebrand factor A domain-containing protein 7 [Trichomycterus rosablanca]|uniref:von Willebrand factor A domain-containing protein 7 n=1 Tax=Trichomycterus rosablanca TaxID=2290929 RepID=UPI002F35F465